MNFIDYHILVIISYFSFNNDYAFILSLCRPNDP